MHVKNFVTNGKVMGGFAFVAYPASGVMTFIISETGIIYEKDVDPETRELAEALGSFDPDFTWHKTE
ncbi:MAG TPA: DUF2950 family protein [Terriglobales bacterium]|jgi:Protein of unknown function (DUF2950)